VLPVSSEAFMPAPSKSKAERIEHPGACYATPDDLLQDGDLSDGEKSKALDTWEQDARQQHTASNEGMAGSREGIEPDDRSRLAQIGRAKHKLGGTPKHKAAH
jgi:hypothetical protein